MSLIDLITGNVGNQVAENSSKKFGIEKGQLIALAVVAAPLIIGALRKNAKKSPEEAEKINNALAKDHDGSVLDNPAQASEKDGSSILDHIFGANRSDVEEKLSSQSGISMDKIGPVLASLAPVIMGYIGKQKASSNVSSGGGISDLLGGILNNAASSKSGTSTSGFDLGAIASAVLGGNKSKNSKEDKGILGGLLDNLF